MAASLSVSAQAKDAPKDAKEPQILEPSSAWQLDYADDSCRLARMFGKGGDTVAFIIERYAPDDRFFLIVAGKPLSGFRNSTADMAFGPDGKERKNATEGGTLGKYAPAFFEGRMALLPLPDDMPKNEETPRVYNPEEAAANTDIFNSKLTEQQEASITWFEARRGSQAPVRLSLGPMAEPMKALRGCTTELLTHWGVDVDAHRGMTRAVAPVVSPGTWITSSDYPMDLLDKGASGIVHFRLTVGIDGKPTNCKIQRSTRPEGFDRAVCDSMMRRAEFQPALGSDGQPIVSYYQNTARFFIP